MTFTKRSLFRKENLPCISSPATETFAKCDLFFGLCDAREPSNACMCVYVWGMHIVNAYTGKGVYMYT